MLSAGRARVLGSPVVLVVLASIREIEQMSRVGMMRGPASGTDAPRVMERAIDP